MSATPRDPARAASEVLQAGSSSFAMAARLFDEPTRTSTRMLYAWCRYCDDAIDNQALGHRLSRERQHDGFGVLARLERETRRACAGRPGPDPAFEGLARVVERHGIEAELLQEHLEGFRMDVSGRRCETLADTLLYAYRVAGVVGLMMARVMGVHEPDALDRACDLGIAFQLTNIARDVIDDAEAGRIYLPADWLVAAGIPPEGLAEPQFRPALADVTARLLEAADPYYESALCGLAALPLRSAWSVAAARDIYRAIGRRVRRLGQHAWDARVSTSRAEKVWLVARGGAVALAVTALPRPQRPQRQSALWRRPGGRRSAAD